VRSFRIRDAFLGLTKFDEFQESLGIARNVLTDRLNRLVDEGIFERVLYNERPARYEYRLSERGSDLFTALNALRQWGDQYLSPKPMRLLRRKIDKRPCRRGACPRGIAGSRCSRDRARSRAGFPAPRPAAVITPSIVIKSVSDFENGRKNDDWQPFCMRASADLTVRLIEEEVI
jgi:DNA-binding HxlR family transcriptional regulator